VTEVALGIDLGTGSTKAVVADSDGRVLATSKAEHPITTPRPGWSETNPEAWIRSARAAVSGVLTAADVEVVALGLSGQMHGVVLSSADGVPVRDAILWSDQRALPDLEPLRARLGPMLDRLANPVVAGMAGPTICALRRSEPGAVAAADAILQPKDWLRLRLTGSIATDPSDASATLLWDFTDDDWSREACEAFGVDHTILPHVQESGSAAGDLTDSGARLVGLAAGIPLATGAADTAAALLGAGMAIGDTQVSTGTGGQIAQLIDRLAPDPTRRTHLFRAALPGGWYAMAAIQNAGIAIDWALRVLDTSIEQAAAAVGHSTSGSGGAVFVPYLTGERTPHLDASLTGCWAGLRPGVSRADMIRSVFEGVACALRDGLDALREAGHTIDRALLAGGGSTSSWWQGMLADVLGIMLVPHDAADASARGAALLGWSAVGHDIDAIEPVRRHAPIEPMSDSTELIARYRSAVGELA